MRDLVNNIDPVQLIAPATITGNTTSSQLDLQGFESAVIEVSVGAATTLSTANSIAVKLTEASESTGSFTAVAQADIRNGASTGSTDGTLITLDSTAEESANYKFGYVGGGRILEVTLTETGTASCVIGVNGIKGNPANAPTATTPSTK